MEKPSKIEVVYDSAGDVPHCFIPIPEMNGVIKGTELDSKIYNAGLDAMSAWIEGQIDKIINANYVDEVMTIEIGSVSDIKDFFNQHLEKVRKELKEIANG